MSLNNFKATIRKWAGLPFGDICNLLTWLDPRKVNFEIDNPHLLIASACEATGEAVAYATVESVYLVESCVVAPQLAEAPGQHAFDAIVSKIEHAATIDNVRRMLIVLPEDAPSDPQEKWIRVVESKMPQLSLEK